MSDLREFVYLDDTSLNSNLSSLGKGIPSEIVHSAEGETEKGGEASGGLMGFNFGGGYSSIDRDAVETTMTITAPYRFQDLLETLDEEGIDIYENPDPRSLARGDVVRIEGNARPMSLFKFEVAIKTIRSLANQDVQASLDELDTEEEGFDPHMLEQLGIFEETIEKYTGDKIPLRFEGDDFVYAASLDRSKMRTDPPSTFVDEEEFKLIGRVERRVLGNDSWDPILATSVMNRYFPDEASSEEMRESLEEMSEEMNIQTQDEDWELEGHTAVIQPIAVFW